MSDPSFANVSLLLHCDGADGSTTFTDSSDDAIAVTAVGGAQIDTAQSKWGGASGLFINAGVASETTKHLAFTPTSVHYPSSGDFTVEFWARPVAVPSIAGGLYQVIRGVGQWAAISISHRANGGLEWYVGRNNPATTPSSIPNAGTLAIGVWSHVALSVSGTSGYCFVNGALVATLSVPDRPAASTSAYIGAISPTSYGFNGRIDDVRVTAGVARYTSAFTPPSAAFPDSAGGSDVVATATPASIGVSPGSGSAVAQRNIIAAAMPASISVTPGTGRAFVRIPATAVATPASISVTPGLGRALSGAALGYPTYRVVRDSYRDPIFSRGKVILSRPLEPGQRLAIERKTPITQLVPFTRDEPFSAEGFEYAMDKITFIQQEIEGHACDCRPKDAEDDAEDKYYEENPDCEPYACDSYTKMLDRYEFEKLRGWTLFEDRDDHPTPFSPNSNWQAYYTDGSGVAVWPSATTDSVDVGVSPAIDPCGGEIKRIFRWNSTVSDRTVKLQRVDYSAFNTLSMVIDSATLRSSTLSGTDEFLLLYVARDYKVTRPSGGDLAFRPSVAVRAQRYTPSGGSLLSGMRVRVISDGYTDAWTDLGVIPSGPVQLTVYAVADGAGYNYVPNPPFTASYRFKLVNLKVIVSITPVVGDAVVFEVEATDVQTVNGYFDFGEGPPTFIPHTPIPTARCWALQGATVDIYELGGLDTVIPVNIDDLVRAFRRNREDYQPPSYCIFPKD